MGSESGPESAVTGMVEYSTPADPGLSMYRSSQMSPDWRMQVLNPVDWNTATYIPAVGIVLDDEGRIIEAAGFWRGRRTDVVYAADKAPMLRWSYSGNVETMTMHYADGTPFPRGDVYGYRITRYSDSSEIEFLDADGSPVDVFGVFSLSFAPDGDGWYLLTMHDSEGIAFSGSDYPVERIRLDENGYVTGNQNLDAHGNSIEIRHGVYEMETVYNANGNVIERKKLDAAGNVLDNPAYPGWKVYERSEDGLSLGYMILDSRGNPAENYAGLHRTGFTYDPYGRLLSARGWDVEGDPLLTNGAWESTIEYDGEFLVERKTSRDTQGNPVEIQGIAETVMFFDYLGNKTEEFFLNSSGQPAEDSEGVYMYRTAFGEHCIPLERTVWEPDGSPGVSSTGYHTQCYIYNETGVFTGIEELDLNGDPL